LRQVFGIVVNAATKLQLVPMMSKRRNCKAQIEISFKPTNLSKSGLLAKSIFAAIAADTKMQCPASAYETIVTITNDYDKNSSLLLELESSEIAALRAAINSYLRLIYASLKISELTSTVNDE
jgi:tRNA threonylcarbamoyladenosine modification (KEOPS) complex  Pcc1 subunit